MTTRPSTADYDKAVTYLRRPGLGALYTPLSRVESWGSQELGSESQREALWLDSLDVIEANIEYLEHAYGLSEESSYEDSEKSDDDFKGSDGELEGSVKEDSDHDSIFSIPSQPFRLLDFPLEIRERIFSCYLDIEVEEECSCVNTTHATMNDFVIYRLDNCRVDGKLAKDIPEPEDEYDSATNSPVVSNKGALRLAQRLSSPLLQTSHQVRDEATTVFYRHCTFEFTTISDLDVFLPLIGPLGRSKLRHIRLYDPLFPTLWNEKWLTEVLATLASCTDLRSLHLEINPNALIADELRDVYMLGTVTENLNGILELGAMPALLKLRVKSDVHVHFGSPRRGHNETYEDILAWMRERTQGLDRGYHVEWHEHLFSTGISHWVAVLEKLRDRIKSEISVS